MGKKFIAFTFQDTSGTIDGKYWDASEDEITRFTAGNVVLLNGKREVYQNKPQVKILHMRLATAEGTKPAKFIYGTSAFEKKRWSRKSIK